MSQAELAAAAAKDSGLDWSERLVARMEAGARPLRYSEAVVLGRVLSVPVATFSDDGDATVKQTARVRRIQRAIKAVFNTGWQLQEALTEFSKADIELARAVGDFDPPEELVDILGEDMVLALHKMRVASPTPALMDLLEPLSDTLDAGKELFASANAAGEDRFVEVFKKAAADGA